MGWYAVWLAVVPAATILIGRLVWLVVADYFYHRELMRKFEED